MEGKQTIIQIAKDIYGETVKVYLFGSRLNDEKRGGDIDLLVRSTWNNKITFQTIQNVTHRKCGDVFVQIFQYVSEYFAPMESCNLEKRNMNWSMQRTCSVVRLE